MITLGPDEAILAIGAVAVAVVGWGANLSVRSALRGPEWALGHITVVSRFLIVPLIAGGVLTFLIQPAWVGLAIVYVAAMVWWLAGMLRRNLIRLREADGFVELPSERREAIVAQARRWLLVGAAALAVLGAWAIGPATSSGVVSLALGAVLGGTALFLKPDGVS